MVAVSTIPLEITEDAARYIEQMGLREPFQRMLDEIPARFEALQWIKVGMEYIVDEANRPIVSIAVARVYPGRDDPSCRDFDRWLIDTFPPEVCDHLIVDNAFVAANGR